MHLIIYDFLMNWDNYHDFGEINMFTQQNKDLKECALFEKKYFTTFTSCIISIFKVNVNSHVLDYAHSLIVLPNTAI